MYIYIQRIKSYNEVIDAVRNRTRVRVVKNKTAPPFKQAEFDILYGVGISREGSLIDLGVEHGIVRKSGAWYTYEGTQLGQGKENSRNFLHENVDMANEIEKKIKEKMGVPTGEDGSSEAPKAAEGEAETKAESQPAPAKSTAKRTTKTTKAPADDE